MKIVRAAVLAAATCASVVQAQPQGDTQVIPAAKVFTLKEAVAAAGGAAPASEAAVAAVEAAEAGQRLAGLRPNPVVQVQVENIAGSGPYRGLRSAETTIGPAIPIELGGKRSARV